MALAERKNLYMHSPSNNPTNLNLKHVRIFQAKACQTIKLTKSHCWISYVSALNSLTRMIKIWHMIRSISGKSTISHLKINNATIEHLTELADVLASTITHNSLSDHYPDRF